MLTTYAVQKTAKGWTLTVSHVVRGMFSGATILGHHKTRKAALMVARLLAGRSGRVVVF